MELRLFGQTTDDAAPAQRTGLTSTVSPHSVSQERDDPGDDTITGYKVARRNPVVGAKESGKGSDELASSDRVIRHPQHSRLTLEIPIAIGMGQKTWETLPSCINS